MTEVFWPILETLKPESADEGERLDCELPTRVGMVNKRLIEWKIYEDLVIENDAEEVS